MPNNVIEKKTGLDLLREDFPENQISKLPKATKKQSEDLKNDFKKGARCNLCDGWHLPDVVHLDYVGHAALTDRLLDADIHWNWEPLAFDGDGLPKFDSTGGLWIKLTVSGQTRLGYGHAASASFKDIGSREKEVIGDALRNAAMRFGAALSLWHKGDLHLNDEEPKDPPRDPKPIVIIPIPNNAADRIKVIFTLAKKASWTEKDLLQVLGTAFNIKTVGRLNPRQYSQLEKILKNRLTPSLAMQEKVEVSP